MPGIFSYWYGDKSKMLGGGGGGEVGQDTAPQSKVWLVLYNKLGTVNIRMC